MRKPRQRSTRKRTTGNRPVEQDPAPVEPELELIEDEDGLELLDDDSDTPVEVTCETLTGDVAFDVRLSITVAEMPKAAVAEAIDGPVRAVASHHAAQLRWQRVVVEFGGAAMISSAAKDAAGEILSSFKPLSVTVRRGYPDELVYEGRLPAVTLHSESLPAAAGTRITVDTGDLADDDLGAALQPELPTLATAAAGTAVDLCFVGGANPRSEDRQRLLTALIDAGAVRLTLTIGEAGTPELLYDRTLQNMVKVEHATTAGADTDITIDSGENHEQTALALGLALPPAAELLAGREVRVQFSGRPPEPAEIGELLRRASAFAPRSLTLVSANDRDQLLPKLLDLTVAGARSVVRVAPGDRDRAGIQAAFVREVTSRDDLAGAAITLDWPAGFELDSDTEQICIENCLLAQHPSELAYTFGGDNLEPVLPAPLTIADGPGGVVCTLDTDAGKPAELARAIARRCCAARDRLAGQNVTILVTGHGAMSRSMRNALLAELVAAPVARAVSSDHGTEDVLLPQLLTVTESDAGIGIAVAPGDRTATQIELAATRETEAAGIGSGATVHLESSSADAEVTAALIARDIGRVVLEGDQPVLIHPRLFEAERDGSRLTLHASPDDDDDALLRQVERELPPLLATSSDHPDVTLSWPGAGKPYTSAVGKAIELIVATAPRTLYFDNGNRTIQLVPEDTRKLVNVIGHRKSATPPMVMLGIDHCDDEETIADIEHELRNMTSDWQGHRVLLIFRDGQTEISAPATQPLVLAVRAILEPHAVATLLFRDAPQRHFVVVHSTLDDLSVGTKVNDPRPRPSAAP